MQTQNDCMLGVETTKDFLWCSLCEKIDTTWREYGSDNTCEAWYRPGQNQHCCVPATCTTTITAPETHTWWNINVLVTFNGEWSYSEWRDFVIDGWFNSPSSCVLDSNNVVCSFFITPVSTWSDINIESPEWRIIYEGDIQCPQAIKTITSSIWWDLFNCEDNDIQKPFTWDNDDCSSYGSGWFEDWTCCTKCDKAPNTASGQNCEETYWPGWDLDNWICCEWDCPKESETAPEWKKLWDNCERVCDPAEACCWIKLNTVVPFIGDCIEMTTQNSTNGANPNSSNVNQLNAFPFLMMGLSKILVTVILIFSFLVVIAAWLMMVTWVYEEWNYKKWMDRVKKVIVALILLWSSGLILKLINPTFFGG